MSGCGFAFLVRGVALTAMLLVFASEPCLAGDTKTEGGDSLDEELSGLEEADFPDLISVDDKSGIMDELAFLEEAGMVELAARHRQEIGMSPSAITVITREDIQASGASTIPDLLRMVPGMDVVWVSPFYTAISARLFWTYFPHWPICPRGRSH